MGVEDLKKLKAGELRVYIATKLDQITDRELPAIGKRLDAGEKRFRDHEARLTQLEVERNTKEKLGINGWSSRKKTALIGTGGAAIIVLIVNAVYQLGLYASWWGG